MKSELQVLKKDMAQLMSDFEVNSTEIEVLQERNDLLE